MRYLNQIFFVFFFTSLSVSAQIVITTDSLNGLDVTGDQVIFKSLPKYTIDVPHLYVTNNTGTTQNWLVTRRIISQPSEWYNYLCWGDLCYGASSLAMWSSSPATIDDSDHKELSIYVSAPTVDTAHYRYYFSTDSTTFIDSVDVIIKVTAVLGVTERAYLKPVLYPNPAQNKISITGTNNTPYSIYVYDISGHQVLINEKSTDSEIDVSSLTNGQYIFAIKNNDTDRITKQHVIIKK